MKQKEQSMVDWTELERLHAEAVADEALADEVFYIKMIDCFPAILAERKAMLAKLEAAQRLRDAAKPFCDLAKGTIGRIPVEKLSGANWHELWKASAAFDKETA